MFHHSHNTDGHNDHPHAHHSQRRRSTKIIDVDEVAVKRERRRIIKKRMSSILKPFQMLSHHHHHHDVDAKVATTGSPTKSRSRSFKDPILTKAATTKKEQPWVSPSLPLRLDDKHEDARDDHHHENLFESPCSSSVVSTSSTEAESLTDHHLHDHEHPTTHGEEEDEQVGRAILLVDDEEEELPTTLEPRVASMDDLQHPHSLHDSSEDSSEEDYDFHDAAEYDDDMWATPLEEPGSLRQALLDEIVAHKHLKAVIVESTKAVAMVTTSSSSDSISSIDEEEEQDSDEDEEEAVQERQSLPKALLEEIVNHSSSEESATESEDSSLEEQDHQKEQKEEATPLVPAKDVLALQQKCENLTTLTELLSKKLVETALCKKKDSSSPKKQRKEAKMYHDMMRQLEAQHRAQVQKMVADQKYLEGQLQRCKVEPVPRPVVQSSKSVRFMTQEEQEKAAWVAARRRSLKPRRRSLMDALVTPASNSFAHGANLLSPSTSTSSSTTSPRVASFSMTSTIFLTNKLLPAMLSAVARGAQHD